MGVVDKLINVKVKVNLSDGIWILLIVVSLNIVIEKLLNVGVVYKCWKFK